MAGENRGPALVAIIGLFTGSAVIVVALRFYAKARTQGSLGLSWDDLFILISIVCGVTDSIGVIYPVTLGFGRHTAEVLAEPGGPERAVLAAKIQMIAYPFNILSFTLPNVAIAILVHKCLDRKPWRVRLLWAMSIIQVVLALIPCIVIYCQCTPIDKLWNTRLEGSCWDPAILNNITYVLTAFTIANDALLAVMPIHVFWHLQLSMRTKISLCAMMGLTLLSAIVTCVKATYLWLFTGAADPLWDVVPLVIWGIVEQNVVIIAACVPPVRRIFSKGAGRGTSGSNSKARSTSHGLGSKISMLFGRPGRAGHSKSATAQSTTDIPLTDQKGNTYVELDSRKDAAARPGIMRTVGVSVRSDDASSQEEILGDGFAVYTRPRKARHFTAVGTHSTV